MLHDRPAVAARNQADPWMVSPGRLDVLWVPPVFCSVTSLTTSFAARSKIPTRPEALATPVTVGLRGPQKLVPLTWMPVWTQEPFPIGSNGTNPAQKYRPARGTV